MLYASMFRGHEGFLRETPRRTRTCTCMGERDLQVQHNRSPHLVVKGRFEDVEIMEREVEQSLSWLITLSMLPLIQVVLGIFSL